MTLEEILSLLPKLALPLLERHYRPDCCIAATRVAVGVIQSLGFKAWPQPTKLRIWNKALWERMEKENGFDGKFRDGEWSVGIGYGEDARYKTDPNWKGFDGHLVAVAALKKYKGPKFLIDLSLGQASRPQKNLEVPPALIVSIDNGWPVRLKINGMAVVYDKHENRKYLLSPDWTEGERTEPIIEQIVKELI